MPDRMNRPIIRSQKAPPPRKRRILVIAVSAAVAVVLIVGIILLVRFGNRSAAKERFAGDVQQYLAITQERPELGEYLRGKVVVIDVGEKRVDDDVFFELPSELRASTPEEVGTIVRLNWGTKSVGYYVDGKGRDQGSALAQTCQVTLIDRSIPAIIARRSFQGDDPSSRFTGNRTGSRPIKKVVEYLVGLPRERGAAAAQPAAGWVVLFRSDNPAVWNTDSPGKSFAIPLRRAPAQVRYLRLKRMDSGSAIILPITREQLARDNRPNRPEGHWWNGSGAEDFGSRLLGVAQVPPAPSGRPGARGVSRFNFDWYTGSGFGHQVRADGKQAYLWQGALIPRTVFEIAVTASPVTAEEKRHLVGSVPDEGPPPPGWVVLFRSADPSLWNTETAGADYAIPVARAHSKVRYLRLKRMDTGDALIVPITRAQLLRQPRPPSDKECAWNGTARPEYRGHHLGIIQGPRLNWPETIAVMNEGGGSFTGSGFGHKIRVGDGQHYCWQGKEIPKTAFEIAVTVGPLTEEERRQLAVAVPLKKPMPRFPPGTPVPEAIAQPDPPPDVPGKKTVDLIPLIDQKQDVVKGRWVVVKNVLHCNDMHGVLRLQLPYQPPAEYDFIVTYSQPRPRNGISLIMPNPRGDSFFCAMGDRGGWGYGIAGPGGKSGSFPKGLPANKAHTATVQVRRDSVRLLLDGKMLIDHMTDFSGLTCDGYRDIPDKSLLAVACDDPTVFHYVRVVEITGTGKKTR